MLDDLRKRRDDEKTQKKKAIRGNNQNAGAGKTSFGFAGASMMGFTSTDMKNAYQTAY